MLKLVYSGIMSCQTLQESFANYPNKIKVNNDIINCYEVEPFIYKCNSYFTCFMSNGDFYINNTKFPIDQLESSLYFIIKFLSCLCEMNIRIIGSKISYYIKNILMDFAPVSGLFANIRFYFIDFTLYQIDQSNIDKICDELYEKYPDIFIVNNDIKIALK